MRRRRWAFEKLCLGLLVGTVAALTNAGSATAFEPRVDDSYFGVSAPHLLKMAVDNDAAGLARHATAMSDAGLDWTRVTIDWRLVEPLLGVGLIRLYDWTATDRMFAALAREGITVMPNPYGTPFWARDLEAILAGCGGNAAVAGGQTAAFGYFTKAIVDRYGPDGAFWQANPHLPRHPVKAVEVWNEPNWTGFWCPGPDPVAFARLLADGAQGVRDADPDVDVILGGLVVIKDNEYFANGSLQGQATDTYMSQLVAAQPNLAALIDVIGIHLYDADVDSNLSLVGWLRSKLGPLGFGGTPLVVTEYGWRTGGPPGSVTAEAQASNLRDLTFELPRTDCLVSAVAPHDWVNLRSDSADPNQWFSLADLTTGTLLPGGAAYAEVVALYEGRGSTPAPRDVIPVCGGEPPDQDEDGVADEEDDYPLDPDRNAGANEPPPPETTQPAEQPTRPARAETGYFSMTNPFTPVAPEERTRHYDEMQRVGVQSVLETIEWARIEPSRPVAESERFRWADIDRRVLGYAKRHIRPSFVVNNPPTWLPLTNADAAYAEFMGVIAARYGRGGDFWEENRHLDSSVAPAEFDVWEGANIASGSWNGTPNAAAYANTYMATRAALRTVDPGARAIVNLHQSGPGGSAPAFLRAMVAARPALAGGIDGIRVTTSARDVASFDAAVVQIRAALDETGNSGADLYLSFGASLVGAGAMTESQRAQFFSQVASRAPRLDCDVDGVALGPWTSRQSDPANAWDFAGVSHLAYAVAWPSAVAYLDAARSALGFGATNPPGAALHPCFREPLDRDSDGVPDAAESYPLDPAKATPEAAAPGAPAFTETPSAWSKVTSPTLRYASADATGFQCRLDSGPWYECGATTALSGLAVGPHTFRVRAVSQLGLLSAVSAHGWTVDLKAPETTITASPSGTVQNENATIELSADEPEVRFACRLDGGAWAYCESPVRYTNLADGPHRFQAFAIDRADNADLSVAWVEFTVRAVPDTPAIFDAQLGSQQPRFSFDALYAASFECRFDEDAFAPCTGTKQHSPVKPLTHGFHRFAVRGVGATGKRGPIATWGFDVADKTAPDTTIAAGPAGQVPVNQTFRFVLASNEDSVRFYCKLDAETWRACEPSVDLSSLGLGIHTFSAAAVDLGGNGDPTPVVREFEVVEAPEEVEPSTLRLSFSPGKRATTGILSAITSHPEVATAIKCRIDKDRWRTCDRPLRLRGLRPGRYLAEGRAWDTAGGVQNAKLRFRVRRR